MMVAMMLPSLVPMLWRYRQAVGRTGETRLGSADRARGRGVLLRLDRDRDGGVIGASSNRQKFGNKALRASHTRGSPSFRSTRTKPRLRVSHVRVGPRLYRAQSTWRRSTFRLTPVFASWRRSRRRASRTYGSTPAPIIRRSWSGPERSDWSRQLGAASSASGRRLAGPTPCRGHGAGGLGKGQPGPKPRHQLRFDTFPIGAYTPYAKQTSSRTEVPVPGATSITPPFGVHSSSTRKVSRDCNNLLSPAVHMPNHKRSPGRQASAEPAVVQEPQPESQPSTETAQPQPPHHRRPLSGRRAAAAASTSPI